MAESDALDPKQRLVWIDVETTGLDPHKDWLLELYAQATDWDLALVGKPFHRVFNMDAVVFRDVDPLIWTMHGSNGLLEACAKSKVHTRQTGQDLSNWFQQHGFKPILAGSTVHFDRAWLLARWPSLEDFLHHRVLDVSGIKEACKRWSPDLVPELEFAPHRAEPDCLASLELMKHFRERLWRMPRVEEPVT